MVLRALIIGLMLLATSTLVTAQPPDPIASPMGLQENREYFSQLPFEYIDTLSGALVLTFNDLVLPGNAGRALKFQRTYNSNLTSPGWTFGLAGTVMHVFASAGPVDPTHPDDSLPVFVTADGARHRSAWLNPPSAPDSDPYRWATTANFWRYDRTTRKLYTPDGQWLEYHHQLANWAIDDAVPRSDVSELQRLDSAPDT